MRILITGCCGFVGFWLCRRLAESVAEVELFGIDNFVRPGAEMNRREMTRLGVKMIHGDLRQPSDVDALPAVDIVIDAAANPSVMAGVDGKTSSRQVVEHNLFGTCHLLEYCRRHGAAFILLSTSRVYAIDALLAVPLKIEGSHFAVDTDKKTLQGLSALGVNESFNTNSPISLYGATKVASEVMALEYGETFGFPVWVNRCGILAGAGQFGRPDQGIIAYWINSWLRDKPLKYIGFNGTGHQTRDCLHPRDLVPLILKQIAHGLPGDRPRIANISGGNASAFSLAELSAWCSENLGSKSVAIDLTPRPFDIPWVILDATLASETWNWQPATTRETLFQEIATHARANPDWLEISSSI